MKTIRVSEKIHKKLQEKGKKGQTFNEIIKQLLEK